MRTKQMSQLKKIVKSEEFNLRKRKSNIPTVSENFSDKQQTIFIVSEGDVKGLIINGYPETVLASFINERENGKAQTRNII